LLANKNVLLRKINYKDMKSYESLADALDDLRKKGYEADFGIETIGLYCGDLDLRLDPEDFHVDEIYRFEGNISCDDSAVLYAISSITGVKGTVVDGYGVHNGNLSDEMAMKLKNHPAMQAVAGNDQATVRN
jgi:hypothetical protein